MKKPSRVTQQDIARTAHVSQATVSRVLAGDGRVEPDKRERVLAAIRAANYSPDVRAQALRRRKTNLIGLVLKRPIGGMKDDPFFASLVAEITQFLVHTPFHLCLDVAEDSDAQSEIYDELLRSRRVDGLIVVEPEADDRRLRKLQEDHFPFVVIGNPRNNTMYSVDNDNVLAGRVATQHLTENGFKSIGMLAGPSGISVSDDRAMGYRMAMMEADLIPKIWHSDFGHRAASETALAILSNPDRPQAMVVMDDFMAMGVSRTAHHLGLNVPKDLALVSFNDTSLCALIDGGLTAVNMNIEQLVRNACRKLIDIVDGRAGDASRSLVSCELKVRASSKPVVGVL